MAGQGEYRALLDSMLQAAVATDLEGRITAWNRAAEGLLGWTKKEVLGRPVTEFMPSEETQKQTEAIQAVLQGGAPWKGRIDVRAKGGHESTVELSASVIKDKKGQMAGLLGVFEDFTERKQLEMDLRERMKELRALNHMATEGAKTAGLESLLRLAVEALEPAFLHEDLWVRARVGDTEATSTGKPPDGPTLAASFDTAAGAGIIEVQYLSTHPNQNQGPFLQEEQALLDAVADSLATFVSRDLATTELQRLAQLVKSVSQAVMATDLEGKITYWNKGAEKIYGWTQEEVIGRSITDVTPSEVSEKQAKEIFSQLQKGESWTGEFPVQRKDGSSFWAMVHDAPLMDDQGHMVGIIGVSFDMTEPKEFQERLRVQAQLLGAVGQAVTATDVEGKITFWNEPAEALYGWTREEAMGRPVAELWGSTYTEEPPTEGVTATAASVDHWVTRKDDSPVLVNLATSPVVEGGRLLGFVAIGQDVTERRTLQRRYQDLVENSPDAIFRTTLDGEFSYTNPAVAHILGYESPEDMARSVHRVQEAYVDPTDRAAVLEAAAKEGSGPVPVRLRRKDGTPVWAEIQARLRDYPDGQKLIEGTFRDLTAERAQQETNERLAAIVESAADAIISIDLDGIVSTWNHGAEAIFGFTAQEAVGSSVFDMTLLPEVRKVILPGILVGLRQGQKFSAMEAQTRNKKGKTLIISMSTAPLHDASGAVTGAAVIIQDISEREAARSLAADNERLKELDSTLREFINAAAHDLNQPLTPMKLAIFGVKKATETMDERTRKQVDMVARNVDRMGLLIQDLLDVARLESGTLQLAPKQIDLALALANTEEFFGVAAENRSVDLVLNAAGGMQVIADELRLSQVLFNLVGNAVKFTPEGGMITVTCREKDNEACIEILDTGPGLTADQIDNLFRPFAQVDNHLPGTPKGTGLGLYISKGIVEQHGGRIGVESAGPGKGCLFWFTLPLAPGEAAETAEAPEAGAAEGQV